MIAGLGNPGKAYEGTPHNVGFDVVDLLARRLDAGWKSSSKFRALTARARIAGEAVMLVKPQTFMNLSGTSIAPLLAYFGGSAGGLTVVLDDVNLPLGRVRVRASGSCGGHNGLASVIGALGTDAFARIRLGVGRRAYGSLVDQVLGKFDAGRLKVVREAEEAAADAAQTLLEKGLDEAMNRYNGWCADAAPAGAGSEERFT